MKNYDETMERLKKCKCDSKISEYNDLKYILKNLKTDCKHSIKNNNEKVCNEYEELQKKIKIKKNEMKECKKGIRNKQ